MGMMTRSSKVARSGKEPLRDDANIYTRTRATHSPPLYTSPLACERRSDSNCVLKCRKGRGIYRTVYSVAAQHVQRRGCATLMLELGLMGVRERAAMGQVGYVARASMICYVTPEAGQGSRY